MIRRLEFRPEASADVAGAFSYYQAQRPGLGWLFFEELHRTTDFIEAFPESCPIVHADLRRALVHRFPYAVYYQLSDELLVVRAVLNTRQNPDTLAGRV